MSRSEAEQRAAVVAEALSWRGTPYHQNACVKGAGVDCGRLVLAVFQNAGLVDPAYDPGVYPIQWHFHQTAERFLGFVEQFAHPLSEGEDPGSGDVVLFKFGKCFSHGAIVIDWPDHGKILHAVRPNLVGIDQVLMMPKLNKLERRFFTVWL